MNDRLSISERLIQRTPSSWYIDLRDTHIELFAIGKRWFWQLHQCFNGTWLPIGIKHGDFDSLRQAIINAGQA